MGEVWWQSICLVWTRPWIQVLELEEKEKKGAGDGTVTKREERKGRDWDVAQL